jgi:hypothetical protein
MRCGTSDPAALLAPNDIDLMSQVHPLLANPDFALMERPLEK